LTPLLKQAILRLTSPVKTGYNMAMLADIATVALRMLLVAAAWACVWHFAEPRTQTMRILRAGILLLVLLGIMAMLRSV
jgi:hypothetical protein